ncbi:SIS domain-containing protein [Roseateles paludis]|uniref:SIS domain-containing protein n=1 Tax=Roseateles paludis TaxID=3145238 RepID=A0ABV0FZE2_9BURK
MSTQMLEEALSAPEAIAHLLTQDAARYEALGSAWRAEPPRGMLTLARGSSDHAAHYFAYLAMARLGRLVTSLPMSLLTLYQSQLDTPGLSSIAFSQSGRSPDLILPTEQLRRSGARTVALVNVDDSPLAQAAEHVLPLHAGPERSVAATKSYIAQLVAGARLVAAWQGDPAFAHALQALPEALRAASRLDWSAALPVLQGADRLFVIGRGLGLPVALEAALKFKETCGIQAEAFSGAEVKHGPMALVKNGYPLLVFAPRGPAQAGLLQLADEMRGRGARVLLAAPVGTPGAELPLAPTAHADLDPIALVQSFYPMVEALARARGRNPDAPPHLAKVTQTT